VIGRTNYRTPQIENTEVPGQLATTLAHKYSITQQNVNNLGGNSNLNIWSPYVNTLLGEVFSLSQEWYVGGSASGLQTEEVGWIVYPAMFGDEKPHFFIFSTPDNYTTGCWNGSCGDFVQVAGSGVLGASFTSSTYGGTQYDFSAEYYLYQATGGWPIREHGSAIILAPCITAARIQSTLRQSSSARRASARRFGRQKAADSGPGLASGMLPTSAICGTSIPRQAVSGIV
jgi:hypothetical protein